MRAVHASPQVRAGLPPGVDGWGVSLNGLMGMVVVGGFLIAGIYYAMQRLVVPKVGAYCWVLLDVLCGRQTPSYKCAEPSYAV